MEKRAMNKKMLRELTLMSNHKEPSVEVLDSLYAQMVLEASIYHFQKLNLQKQIDHVLERGQKDHFMKLSEQYNEILDKYKDGIKLSEQGYEFTVQLEG